MPKLARNYEYGYGQRYAQAQRQVVGTNPNFRKPLPKRAKKKVYKVKSKKFNPIASLARLAIGAFFAGIVIPYSFNNYTLETFYNPIKNRNIKVDHRQIMTPTMAYMSNDYFMNTPMRSSAADKNSIMQHLFESDRMTLLETRLMQLMKQYPMVKPAIYVWEYEHGKYVNINADEEFPVASIIKIPVLIEMFRSIEAGQFKLYDTMVMGEHYVTPGSGSLQFSQVNSVYSMDKLARHMIEESDNTSTNMIMSKIGGKHSVNRSINMAFSNHISVPDLLYPACLIAVGYECTCFSQNTSRIPFADLSPRISRAQKCNHFPQKAILYKINHQ